MKGMNSRPLLLAAAFAIAICVMRAQAPPVKGPTVITSARPLNQAASILRHLYGKVVTYEEPVWNWSGDSERLNRVPGAKNNLEPKRLTFTMPADTGVEANISLILQRTLDAFHAKSSGPQFKVLASKWGYHITPALAHGANGELLPATSILDATISVAVQQRDPYQHVRALLAAVTASTGVRIGVGIQNSRGFNRLFRAAPASFKWGAQNMVARDALIDLLERSATTFGWNLHCQPGVQPGEQRLCAMNMHMLEVNVSDMKGNPTMRVLKFDRCGDCPPVLQGADQR